MKKYSSSTKTLTRTRRPREKIERETRPLCRPQNPTPPPRTPATNRVSTPELAGLHQRRSPCTPNQRPETKRQERSFDREAKTKTKH
ncbi:hypothetical protein Bca4012_045304 [Brassica carinata]